MNAGRYVLVAAAFCALSTSVASARHHHGLRSNGSAGGAASGVTEGSVTDKNAADQFGPRSKRASGTGSSGGPETGVVPHNENGRNQAFRPVPGGVSANGGDDPIDTSITVNQGPAPRDARRGRGGKDGKDVDAVIAEIRQRLQGKLSSTAGPKTSGLQPPLHGHRPKFSTKNAASATRNAVGALIERGSTQGSATTGLHEPGPRGPGGVVGGVAGQPGPGGAPTNNASLNVLHNGHSDPEGATITVPSVHDSGINGTHLVRPSAGLGSLGGSAKFATGISGSNVRTRHP